MSKIYNRYIILAIIFSTIVIFSPLYLYIILNNLNNFLDSKYLLILLTALFIFLNYIIGEILIRPFGIKFEKKIFENGKKIPTYLVLSGKKEIYNEEKIDKILKKIKKDYKINILKNKDNYKKINNVVEDIRYKIADGRLLLGTNSLYGMVRNIIGNSLLGFVLSFIFIVINYNNNLYFLIFYIFLLFFGLIYLFRKLIINYYGFIYAKQLFIEYLTYKKD